MTSVGCFDWVGGNKKGVGPIGSDIYAGQSVRQEKIFKSFSNKELWNN